MATMTATGPVEVWVGDERGRFERLSTITASREARRWRYYSIGIRELCEVLATVQHHWFHLTVGTVFGCPDRLPPDARFVDLHHDYSRRAFLLRFEHPTFDEVQEGCETPYGGHLTLWGSTDASSDALAKEIEEQTAIIHDLREQLRG